MLEAPVQEHNGRCQLVRVEATGGGGEGRRDDVRSHLAAVDRAGIGRYLEVIASDHERAEIGDRTVLYI